MFKKKEFPLCAKLAASEIIQTIKFAVFLRNDNIIQIQLKDNFDYVVEDAIAIIEAIKTVSDGNKYPAVAIYGEFISLAREGEKLIANHDLTVIDALVINNNLGLRIIAQFYLLFVKPKRPTKIFNDLDSALVWIKKQDFKTVQIGS